MSFVHPLLLGGLLLVGIPVLIHLIMRQKPKHLLFPAMRFLVQRVRTNQRSMRLRHLILLLLRMALIALICLALARPKFFSERISLGGGKPVAVALVFDTSASMEYPQAGKSRLVDAKQRARELLDDLPEESRVAVFDSAEPVSGEWQQNVTAARNRVEGLQIRYANLPVTDVLDHAYRLLAGLEESKRDEGEPMPRFLYVFSDRAEACWDEKAVPRLTEVRNQIKPPKVQAVFVDVGVETPTNLAIGELELPKQAIAANQDIVINTLLQVTGKKGYDTTVLCRFDNDKNAEPQPVRLTAGQGGVVTFKRSGFSPGLHRAEVSLAAADNLPFSSTRTATFEVRGAREMLLIVDDPGDEAKSDDPRKWEQGGDGAAWKSAMVRHKQFACKVVSTAQAVNLGLNDLNKYKAICLLDVARPGADLWAKLEKYVSNGGGLAIVPGGDELDRTLYTDDNADTPVRKLMPAQFVKLIDDKEGATWKDSTSMQPPVKGWFLGWEKAGNVEFIKFPSRAYRYWEVKALPGGDILASYNDKDGRPALLERKQGRGRVVLFTTPLDGRTLGMLRRWNDYLENRGLFYLSMTNKIVGFLAGDEEAAAFNYTTGQTVPIALPVEPRFHTYTLQVPGNAPALSLPRSTNQDDLRITPEQAPVPGAYTLIGSDGKWQTGFSLNVPAAESILTKVSKEKIEGLLGENALLPVGHNINLKEALQGHWSQPVELFPWLMILLLLALAVENLLSNRFYKREAATEEKTG